MDEVAQRIKQIRTENNLTQEEMSARLGIKRYQIADIESGKVQLSMKLLKLVSENFHIDVYWLMYGDNPPEKLANTFMKNLGVSSMRLFHKENDEKQGNINDIENIRTNKKNAFVSLELSPNATVQKMGQESIDGVFVDVVDTVGGSLALIPELDIELAAGTGRYPSEHALAVGTRSFSIEWINKKGLTPNSLRLVRVYGDSMSPSIKDKDIVMIELNSKLSFTMPVAFRLNEELYIKNYQAGGDGSIHMLSANKEYDPIIIDPKNPPEDFQIIGSVVWSSHSYV